MLHVVVIPKVGPKLDFDHQAGPLILGRLADGSPPSTDLNRLEWKDPFVSARHIELIPENSGEFIIRNISRGSPARLPDGTTLLPNCEMKCATLLGIPFVFSIGETQVSVELTEQTQASIPVVPLDAFDKSQPLAAMETAADHGAERLAKWLNAVVDLQRSAASSNEFFQQTGRAMVELIGLDRGLVLLKRKNRWSVEARFPAGEYDGPGREFSTSVLARIEEDRKTYFSDSGSMNASESMASVQAVVASPIMNHKGLVIGAVYGIRNKNSKLSVGITIGNLEAQMVRLLASTVAVGMARLETAANFEAFFGQELALELEKNPGLLAGQERTVSVLFADIRGFSRFSQQLGAPETCKLVGDVMDKLSRCVREQKGVIVSFMGDGILAMWNAPQEQPDHAERAVRAGHAMIRCLGDVNTIWSGRAGSIKVGVGISSGPAVCGNTGSSIKFQYGPLGNTVNVASRVEGATKHFGVSMMVTGSTRELLGGKFINRRVRTVRLKGIPEDVELFEVFENADAATAEALKDFSVKYERALGHYEQARHLEAVRALQEILANNADPDGPTLALLMRSVAALGQIEQGTPIEEMFSK